MSKGYIKKKTQYSNFRNPKSEIKMPPVYFYFKKKKK
jgi:hypothetical protein